MKAKLVLLCLSATTVGVVSCEKEVTQSKTNNSANYQNSKRGSEYDTSRQEVPIDTLKLLISPHGNKGSGKLGDD